MDEREELGYELERLICAIIDDIDLQGPIQFETYSGTYYINLANLIRGLFGRIRNCIAESLGFLPTNTDALPKTNSPKTNRLSSLRYLLGSTQHQLFVDHHRQTENLKLSFESFYKHKLFAKLTKHPPPLFDTRPTAEHLRFLLDDALGRLIYKVVSTAIRDELASTFQEIDSLALLNPTGILAINWMGSHGEALRAYAKCSGIPFRVLQHGLSFGWNDNRLTRVIHADEFLVWGEGYRREIESESSVRIRAVKNPTYRNSAGFAPPKQITRVLVAPTAFPPFAPLSRVEFWNSMLQLALDHPLLEFQFRSHKQDFIPLSRPPANVAVASAWDKPMYQALQNVDLVITNPSTTVIDASVAQRPILLVDTTLEPEFLTKDGHFTKTPLSEVAEEFRELLTENQERIESQLRFIESYFTAVDEVEDIVS